MINGGPVLCKCGNTARYINERGELCCSLCPLKEGIDAIQLADVPKLLAWARQVAAKPDLSMESVSELRDIVQRRPELRT